MSAPTCEMCRFALPDDYPWRAKCLGCRNLHTLCVDCGCRHARRTGLQDDAVWVELDACPDEVAVAAALAGDIGEDAEREVVRVFRSLAWEPADEQTANKALEMARESGLPTKWAWTDMQDPGVIVLTLADGREIRSS